MCKGRRTRFGAEVAYNPVRLVIAAEWMRATKSGDKPGISATRPLGHADDGVVCERHLAVDRRGQRKGSTIRGVRCSLAAPARSKWRPATKR